MNHIRQALTHLIAKRDLLNGVIATLEPMAEPVIVESPQTERAQGRAGQGRAGQGRAGQVKPATAKRRAKKKPGPKPKAAVRIPPPPGESRPSGRQPSPQSAACRSAVLLTLLAAPAALSFVEVREAIAPVMAKNGVRDEAALSSLIQATATALQQKGFIKRAAGAWKLTDDGRAEGLRIRAAVKGAQA